jgi:5'(3')-deoxyribonucleotidase
MENEKVGLRFDNGKSMHDLLEPFAEEQLARIFTKGARKYAPNNWLNGMHWSKMIGPLRRHLNAFLQGKDYDFDPDCSGCKKGECVNHTGELHIAQVAWNAMCLTSYYKHFPQGDNRFSTSALLRIPNIGLDIDEVLADWVGAWIKLHNIKMPSSWFFDRDIVAKFDKMKKNKTLNKFYLSIKPKINPDEMPFEPWAYVTSRPVDTSVTEEWLDRHGFPARPVITVPLGASKVDAIKSAGIEVFVDDRHDNFLELNRAGVTTFLFDAPHNQRYKNVGYKRIKSLNDLPWFKH